MQVFSVQTMAIVFLVAAVKPTPLSAAADGRFGKAKICFQFLTSMVFNRLPEQKVNIDPQTIVKQSEGIVFEEREVDAVKQYAAFQYLNINPALREGKVDTLDPILSRVVAGLDAAIAKCPNIAKYPLLLYRGESFKKGRPIPKVNETVEFKSFMSTSLDRNKAKDFGFRSDFNGSPHDLVLFEISFPQKASLRGIYLPTIIGTETGEFEVVLPRNLKFRVESSVLLNPGEAFVGRRQIYYQGLRWVP